LIPGAEPWATILEKVVQAVGKSTKDIADLKELDIVGKKEKVAKALKKVKKPIVVVIDDIDRLTPKETFQILRLVKAVADFPGTVFLLAFDPVYIRQTLKDNHIEKSDEYVDKVIQLRVPFTIRRSNRNRSILDEISEGKTKSLFYITR